MLTMPTHKQHSIHAHNYSYTQTHTHTRNINTLSHTHMMLAYAILIYFCLSPRSVILTLLSQLKKMKCINKTIQRNTLIYIKENGIDTINASGFSHTHTHAYIQTSDGIFSLIIFAASLLLFFCFV